MWYWIAIPVCCQGEISEHPYLRTNGNGSSGASLLGRKKLFVTVVGTCIDVAVISVPHERVSPTVKFPIQFVEVDTEARRGGYDPLAWISDCLNSFGLYRFFH